ncbi:MAG TPA: HigA family addiction module antitoxin, partial [Sphingomicrobium sp.]|nr:HigA family addiction module antitoxin [Sphingomicrobium sp.]
ALKMEMHGMSKSSITIDHRGLPVRVTTSPGEMLRAEFLEPLGMSANALALALRVPANRVTAIINGERAVTADTAMRLARYFGTSARFWLNLQQSYDLSRAAAETGAAIAREVLPREHSEAA